MSAMTWDYDICLSCDNHTRDGEKYCSQTCRLADYERGAQNSEPATPASHCDKALSWDTWHMPSTSTTSAHQYFQLPPPVNFSVYHSNQRGESPPASPRAQSSSQPHLTSYFPRMATSYASASPSQAVHRSLTLSPSRSSLSSISSTSSGASTPGLTQDVLDQLRDYTGAFDQTRAWKHRVAMG